jgi:hypothetical protein
LTALHAHHLIGTYSLWLAAAANYCYVLLFPSCCKNDFTGTSPPPPVCCERVHSIGSFLCSSRFQAVEFMRVGHVGGQNEPENPKKASPLLRPKAHPSVSRHVYCIWPLSSQTITQSSRRPMVRGREHRAAVAARLRLGECRVTETLGSRDAGKGAIPANGRASASYCSAALTVCTILNFLLMSCNKATTSYFLGWL